MIAMIWRYRVKPAHRSELEVAYGSDGDWARLFRRHEHYLGTELLHSPFVTSSIEGRAEDAAPNEYTVDYLTIDRWRSEADFTDFMAAHGADYDALDAATEGWSEEEVKLGVWSDSNAIAPARAD